MKKLNSPLQFRIFRTIVNYIQIDPTCTPTRWECVNYLIGFYGAITADHIAAINAAVRKGIIVE